MGSIDEGTLRQYIPGGGNFPADWEEVVSEAERNGAPQKLVEDIRGVNSVEEVFEWLRGKRHG